VSVKYQHLGFAIVLIVQLGTLYLNFTVHMHHSSYYTRRTYNADCCTASHPYSSRIIPQTSHILVGVVQPT